MLQPQRGFIMMVSVLIISALGVALAITLLSTSLLGYQDAGTLEQSAQARFLADTCAELALAQAASCSSTPYILSTPSGDCGFTSLPAASTRTILASSTVNNIVRKIKLFATISSSTPSTVSWQEVQSF